MEYETIYQAGFTYVVPCSRDLVGLALDENIDQGETYTENVPEEEENEDTISSAGDPGEGSGDGAEAEQSEHRGDLQAVEGTEAGEDIADGAQDSGNTADYTEILVALDTIEEILEDVRYTDTVLLYMLCITLGVYLISYLFKELGKL